MLIILADNVLVGPKLCETQRCEKFEMFVLALSNDDERAASIRLTLCKQRKYLHVKSRIR